MLQQRELTSHIDDFPIVPLDRIENLQVEAPGEPHSAFRGMLTAVMASAVFWISLFALAGLLL